MIGVGRFHHGVDKFTEDDIMRPAVDRDTDIDDERPTRSENRYAFVVAFLLGQLLVRLDFCRCGCRYLRFC